MLTTIRVGGLAALGMHQPYTSVVIGAAMRALNRPDKLSASDASLDRGKPPVEDSKAHRAGEERRKHCLLLADRGGVGGRRMNLREQRHLGNRFRRAGVNARCG